MTLSLNDRARELADRLAADSEAARVEVTTSGAGDEAHGPIRIQLRRE